MNIDPRCVLLLVHGLGTYSGRWKAMAGFFLNKGIPSYPVDLPKFNRINSYYCEILRIRETVAKENPDRKIFLVGESLGALASFLLAAERPELFDGLICISPAFASKKAIRLTEAMNMLAPIFYNPSKQVDLPFDSSMCTRDTDCRKKLEADPLEYRSISVRLVLDIFMAQMKAKAALKKIRTSVLFLTAGKDMIVDTGVSRKIFDSLEVKDKTFVEFPGMYHSLSIELGKEAVFEELFKWVEKRL